MDIFKVKRGKIAGSEVKEVKKEALEVYKEIKNRTKRKPYIRSRYFNKQKIFFDYFWIHLTTKSRKIQTQRLKYLPCAIDLIIHSRNVPTSKENPNNRNEILHRFFGITRENEEFYVQIKEEKKTGAKYLMSVFGNE